MNIPMVNYNVILSEASNKAADFIDELLELINQCSIIYCDKRFLIIIPNRTIYDRIISSLNIQFLCRLLERFDCKSFILYYDKEYNVELPIMYYLEY